VPKKKLTGRAPSPPCMDFEPYDLDAALKTMWLMCRFDEGKRAQFIKKFDVFILGWADRTFVSFMKDAVSTSADGIPPEGTLAGLISEHTRDDSIARNELQKFVTKFSTRYHLAPGIDRKSSESTESLFWARISDPLTRERAQSFPEPLLKLMRPDGGLDHAMASGESLDSVIRELRDCIFGYPMLAGLILYYVMALKQNHYGRLILNRIPKMSVRASQREAMKIIAWTEVGKALAEQGFVRDVHHLQPEFVRWRSVAPLWAAAMVEADCWTENRTPDFHRFEGQLYEILGSGARCNRMLGTAKSFAAFATRHAVSGASNESMLVPLATVIRFPKTLAPLPLVLPALPSLTLSKLEMQ